MNEVENNNIPSTNEQPKVKPAMKEDFHAKGDLSKADASIDGYVVPKYSYKKKQKLSQKNARRRRRTGKNEADRLTPEERDKIAEGFVFQDVHRKKRKKKKRHHMKKGKKIAITIISIILGLVIAVAGTFIVIKEIGKRQLLTLDKDSVNIEVPDDLKNELNVQVSDDGKTITYDGHTYKINSHVMSMVFMGLDANETNAEQEQADAIYIAAIDTSKKSIKILGVSRETMCDVDVYTSNGTFARTENMQLCLAYDYGKGSNGRAENVEKSLSRLFFNMPFETYFGLDMTCISTLNDEVGGVSVIPNISFTSRENGREIISGESVVLQGLEAEQYVRARDTSKLDSNNARMARQQEYMKNFLASVVPAAKKKISVVSSLYNTVTKHSVSNINLPKLLYFASTSLDLIESSKDIQFENVQGTIKEGKFAEFYPDEKALLELMLSTFYLQID